MAEQAKKKPAKMANRNLGAEAVKDDGEKYAVVNGDGRPVYPGAGVALGEAVRLGTRQPTQQRGLQVVRRHEVLLPAARRREQRGRRVIPPVGEELKRQERVGGAALAQVDLDRVRLPGPAPVADDDEIDGEAAEHPRLCEALADPAGLGRDRARIREVGWEPAAQEGLAAGASEELIMSGEHLHATGRRHAQLDARAAELAAGDPLLDDPAVIAQTPQVILQDNVALEGHPLAPPSQLL